MSAASAYTAARVPVSLLDVLEAVLPFLPLPDLIRSCVFAINRRALSICCKSSFWHDVDLRPYVQHTLPSKKCAPSIRRPFAVGYNPEKDDNTHNEVTASATSTHMSREVTPGVILRNLRRVGLSDKGKLIRRLNLEFAMGEQLLSNADLSYLPRHLTTLNLNACQAIDDLGASALNELSELRILELYWNVKLTDQSMAPLLKEIGGGLKVLNLSGCKGIADESIKALVAAQERHRAVLTRSGKSMKLCMETSKFSQELGDFDRFCISHFEDQSEQSKMSRRRATRTPALFQIAPAIQDNSISG
eukprot:GHVT01077963.1.p1 GENE.GHVT01077963.1~~GHVT01077963.1.p1  ORF type:complete len:304 (-),score=4.09 GHVT01077963.1:1432-2343(-)